ncbi:MAG: N,N-dimethylformamidase large subunit [Rhodospirillaceae bacterium]|nr:N,N-dimethylformamidase large subunit [Rhodospirillaceae bacterium]MBT5192566.1 N,N-dimethylformamidase large subunit [Rhodospirillaceae bacterium]MBT5897968.1 N,N-dimethylformamidase large subunit [Rhodospirillaceae bacterium]
MIPLIGYGDRLSGRAGDTIEFKVSSISDTPFTVSLFRSISADPNPAGPGMIERAVPSAMDGNYPSRRQSINAGSAGVADRELPAAHGSFRLSAVIWPTLPLKGEQVILSCGDIALMIDETGATAARAGSVTACSGVPLHTRTWYRVWLSYDGDSGVLTAGQQAIKTGDEAHGTVSAPGQSLSGRPVIAARDDDGMKGHFNGKIETPAIHGHGDELIASWDFTRDFSTTRIEDTGPHGLHGQLINLPARAMTGSAWNGEDMCFRHRPEHYGAVHFHDDDIYDLGWETDFSFTIPDDLPSGAYIARIQCDGHEDAIPFFVCPPLGKPSAKLCVLVSTFTYVIYGNYARPAYHESWHTRVSEWDAYPWNPAVHPEYGLSTYNFHGDGSGICHASHLRPLFNVRPGFLSTGTGEDSGLRHLPADSHLLYWLDQQGIDYDIITDQQLHEDGLAAIAPYPVMTTGSHPEYHTAKTLDAIEGYRDGGGNLMYLGGNGFYWRIALHESEAGTLEIRRGEGGIRAWAAEPGEYFNAFDGTYGGLWRRNGRAPQSIAGLGFTAQGNFTASYYRRLEASQKPEFAWMFEGIDDEIIGDFGLSGGGAAGFEVDRTDYRLGTPENAVIVAQSENHDEETIMVPEEMLTHVMNWSKESTEDLIRADMIYYTVPGGGQVFSTGSITYCGCLPWNGGDNNISKLTGNVLRRFLEG